MNTIDSEFIKLEVPARYKYLNVVAACIEAMLERAGIDDSQETLTYNVSLAIHETCTNIIEHAYKEREGRIGITVSLGGQPHRITVDLLDSGVAFDWAHVETPDLDTPQEGNYGLFLATALMDDIVYTREGQTNHWQLVKQL